MPQVNVSEATFERLKALAEPLVDDGDSVIQRLLDCYGEDRASLRPGGDFRGDHERAKPGDFTAHQDLREPLLQVLREAGGKLKAGDAIDRVGELMENHLNEVDQAHLPSGEVRWRNNVRWACDTLKRDGKISRTAPHGIWELASH